MMTDPRGVGVLRGSSPHEVRRLETVIDDVAVVLDDVDSEQEAIAATDQNGSVVSGRVLGHRSAGGRRDAR